MATHYNITINIPPPIPTQQSQPQPQLNNINNVQRSENHYLGKS